MPSSNPPKIVVVSNLYPLTSEGRTHAVTVAVKTLITGAYSHGMNVIGVVRLESVFRNPRSRCKIIWDGGIKVLDVPRISVREWLLGWATRLLAGKDIYKMKPDIVVCHRATNLYFAKKVFGDGPKYVFVLHQSDFSSRRLKHAVVNSDQILSRSKPLKDRLVKIYPSVDVAGIVGSGINPAMAKKKELSFVGSEVLEIVFAGRLVELKNVDQVLVALVEFKRQGHRFVFKVLGDGPLRDQLEKKAVELGIGEQVAFFGHVSKAEVLETMRKSHIFVMPSAPETFGLAYLEAMSQGCVVIGHRGWGVDGLIEEGVEGYLVDDASAQTIMECFLRYKRLSTDLRFAMHESAFDLAARNDLDSAAINYKSLVESALRTDG